ncbi:hypothetical protein CRG98_047670 [Punica granatum]|uniref:Uncharacterized protein n=1 Tax=Punica granatum TaxID=22663 RepID=A0A2I0HJR5_PUNGR|nr:hypothetical protein CRG98_047670 [Punica granatum]
MNHPPRDLKWWRNFFHGLNLSPLEIIDYAIEIAKVDCPREFDAQKLGITERLFSSRYHLPHTSQQDDHGGEALLALGTKAKNDAEMVVGTVNKNVYNHLTEDYRLVGSEEGELEIIEENSIGVVTILNKKSDDCRDVARTFNNANSNKRYSESKEEIIRETLRIKKILDNHQTVIFSSDLIEMIYNNNQ